jgi:hypothetical protein
VKRTARNVNAHGNDGSWYESAISDSISSAIVRPEGSDVKVDVGDWARVFG